MVGGLQFMASYNPTKSFGGALEGLLGEVHGS